MPCNGTGEKPCLFKGVVHPWFCDAMGHLTTRHYSAMFDDASYHLLRAAFGYNPGSEAWHNLGWADVRHVFEYKTEVAVGRLIEIFGTVTKIGGKSFSSRYEMKDISTGKVAATFEVTTVFFDLKERKAIPLTNQMRIMAETFMTCGKNRAR